MLGRTSIEEFATSNHDFTSGHTFATRWQPAHNATNFSTVDMIKSAATAVDERAPSDWVVWRHASTQDLAKRLQGDHTREAGFAIRASLPLDEAMRQNYAQQISGRLNQFQPDSGRAEFLSGVAFAAPEIGVERGQRVSERDGWRIFAEERGAPEHGTTGRITGETATLVEQYSPSSAFVECGRRVSKPPSDGSAGAENCLGDARVDGPMSSAGLKLVAGGESSRAKSRGDGCELGLSLRDASFDRVDSSAAPRAGFHCSATAGKDLGLDLNEAPKQEDGLIAADSADRDLRSPEVLPAFVANGGLETTRNLPYHVFPKLTKAPSSAPSIRAPAASTLPGVTGATAGEEPRRPMEKKLSWKDFSIFSERGVWAGNSGTSGGLGGGMSGGVSGGISGGGLSGGSFGFRNPSIANGRPETASMSWKSDSHLTAQMGNLHSWAAGSERSRRITGSGEFKAPKSLGNSWANNSERFYEVDKPSEVSAGKDGYRNLAMTARGSGVRATRHSVLQPQSVLGKRATSAAFANVGRQLSEPLLGNKRPHLSHADYTHKLSSDKQAGYGVGSQGHGESDMTFASDGSGRSRTSDKGDFRNNPIQHGAFSAADLGASEKRSWGVAAGSNSHDLLARDASSSRETAGGSWGMGLDGVQSQLPISETPNSAYAGLLPQSSSLSGRAIVTPGTRTSSAFRHSFDSVDTLDADLIEIRRRAIMSLPPIGMRHVRPEGYTCSFCGLNFATSQALGGHMTCHLRRRRHSVSARENPGEAGEDASPRGTRARGEQRDAKRQGDLQEEEGANAAAASGAAARGVGAEKRSRKAHEDVAAIEARAAEGAAAGDASNSAADDAMGGFTGAVPKRILSGFSRYTHAIAGIDLLNPPLGVRTAANVGTAGETPTGAAPRIGSAASADDPAGDFLTSGGMLGAQTGGGRNARNTAVSSSPFAVPAAFSNWMSAVEPLTATGSVERSGSTQREGSGDGMHWQGQLQSIQAALTDWKENGNRDRRPL